MQLADFLQSVVSTPEGHFLLATRSKVAGWAEHFYEWPRQREEIIQRAQRERAIGDVYFSAHLFDSKKSVKSAVLPSLTVQADLDGADVRALPITPTVLVRTSPGRHQGYWRLQAQTALPPDEIARLSRRLAYAVDECDRSGWTPGHRVRLPDTLNYKYSDTGLPVSVVAYNNRRYDPDAFDLLPLDEHEETTADELSEWMLLPHTPLPTPAAQLIHDLRDKVGGRTVAGYDRLAQDRSTALFSLMCTLFRAGLSRDVVYWLAYNSPNNKFKDSRYNDVRDLRHDVLRAERKAKRPPTDLKDAIMLLRGGKELMAARRAAIAHKVRQTLSESGEFMHARDGTLWYVPRDLGRPIQLAHRSDALDTLLATQFGLNPTETEQRYTVADLCAYTQSLPQTTIVANLSYYDSDTRTLLVHAGGRDVLAITERGAEIVPNGHSSVLFRWDHFTEPFGIPRTGRPGASFLDWPEFLFGSSLTNLVNMDKAHARSLLAVWFLFVLFRSAATTKPILALFGQPGAGKSTLFALVYAVLYGRFRELSSVTTPEDFDSAVSHDPLVVLDNVDGATGTWLPNALALSAKNSQYTKRKLWTDNDTVVITRQAVVGLTAHNPQFTREDVTDRLVIITMARRATHGAEKSLIDAVQANRGRLWASIVDSITKVLATPMPDDAEIPEFRVADFAKIGLWIARALGIEQPFRAGLENVRGGQRGILLEEDQMLVVALLEIAKRQKTVEFRPVSQLWSQLQGGIVKDWPAFTRVYKNSQMLGKKLWTLHDSLKSVMRIEWEYNGALQARTWLIDTPPSKSKGAKK